MKRSVPVRKDEFRRAASLTLTVPQRLKDRLQRSAALSGRLLSQEAAYRLQESFRIDDMLAAGLVDERTRRQVTP